MLSTSAGGSWLICGLLLMMNAFTTCLETASKTKWLKQQNLTEYMDAVEVAICLGCHSPRFLAELSDFWKQPLICSKRGFQTSPALALNTGVELVQGRGAAVVADGRG